MIPLNPRTALLSYLLNLECELAALLGVCDRHKALLVSGVEGVVPPVYSS